jgi:hypothetical protein
MTVEIEKPVFVSKVECGVCCDKVLAINLELVTMSLGGRLWACDDCRKELREIEKNGI